jgi:hypothetical protein
MQLVPGKLVPCDRLRFLVYLLPKAWETQTEDKEKADEDPEVFKGSGGVSDTRNSNAQ